MNDTDPRIAKRYRRMLMEKSPSDRVHMAASMFDTAKAIALAALREEHPQATERELKGLLFLRMYGRDFRPRDRKRICEFLVDGVPQQGR